ncbi:flagellar hook-length control protein FliK [Cohnella sp. REN36]|uniref:flagellar hook-length control protein FliK n=1 Tax=Cohnella sp. REN36 TaxID=2887347 RepID=UPI001D13CE91|nr:flagellar hook-length control protein FliK [Cohnella sp. REN36]MCC3376235.1 flagellar hook-length control protein FliK [Cohnella sp. REN36]
MNIPVLSASAGQSTAPAAGGKAAGGNGAGFASALVQAIGGTGGANGASGGSTPSLGLLGLFGTIGQTDEGTGGANPAEALLALLDQLTSGDAQPQADDELPDDLMDQLAQLLAGLQALLPQAQPTSEGTPEGEPIPSGAAQATEVSPLPAQGGNPLLAALKEALLQTKTLPDDAALPNEQLDDAAKQLRQWIATGNAKPETANAPATAAIPGGTSPVQQEAAIQQPTAAAAAPVEPKRAANVFREPILHWNLQPADAGATNGEVAEASATTAGEAAGDDASALTWTLSGGETAGKTDGAAVKAALPAQVPVQQFAEQMEKYLVKQFTLSGGNGTTEARLSLTPEHLGQVEIRLVLQNGQLNAHFVAHNEAAKELLETQLSQLRSSLQVQGIQVERMEVVQRPELGEATSFLHQEQRRSSSGDGQGGRSGRRGSSQAEEPVAFESELERTASLRDAGYGNELNVQA